MANTFYIKKTAYDDNGTLPEKDANSIVIGPGEVNGPNGVFRDTDITLFGYNAVDWGQHVDQNFLRLLENFACPEKELGDYNPATGQYDFDPATSPTTPKDEKDLGIGNGITNPVLGQLWFNTTKNSLYYYGIGGWQSFTDGLVFTGDINMSFNHIINLADPTNPTDALNLQYADNRYVNITGDVMSGDLSMGGNHVTNIADPILPQDAVSLSYLNTNFVSINGNVINGNLTFNTDDGDTNLFGIKWNKSSDGSALTKIKTIYNLVTGGDETFLQFENNGNNLRGFKFHDVQSSTDLLEINNVSIYANIPYVGTDLTSNTLTSTTANITDLNISNTINIGNTTIQDGQISYTPTIQPSITERFMLNAIFPLLQFSASHTDNTASLGNKYNNYLFRFYSDSSLTSFEDFAFNVEFDSANNLITKELDVGNGKIVNLADPILDNDAVNFKTLKNYATTYTITQGNAAHGTYLPLPTGLTNHRIIISTYDLEQPGNAVTHLRVNYTTGLVQIYTERGGVAVTYGRVYYLIISW